jgi:DNA-binding NtrC family response regulator
MPAQLTAVVQRERRALRILVVDDDPLAIELFKYVVQRQGLEIHGANTGSSALELAKRIRPNLAFVDLGLPDMSGLDVLERMLHQDHTSAVVLFTANPATDSAVAAIQKGAYDYIAKPISIEKLNEKVHQYLEHLGDPRQSRKESYQEILAAFRDSGIVGRSPAILEMYSKVLRIAPYFETVLVTGETGTGKELVARSLHDLSKITGPFVSCNCAAIVETLFESELFGYMRGSFTGATQDKIGLIEYANGGTLFLDEVGELPLSLQAKLLRVLQQREVQRVGAVSSRPVNLRVVAATNRDLRAMVAARQFREDLFYRLSMIEVRLPSLANRKEDLQLLERHFLQVFATRYKKPLPHLTRRAQALLARYTWPGNIRELENVLGYCSMVCESGVIDVSDFPEWMQNQTANDASDENFMSMHDLERHHAHRVLEACRGNRVRAAAILGISRATLYRLMAETPQAACQSKLA